MTDPVSASAPVNRRPFYLVLLLFFAPLLVAFVLYYGSAWRPAGTTNKGELISPAIALPEADMPTVQGGATGTAFLRDDWTLVYVTENTCAAECQQALNAMRNVRQLLGKDMSRTAAALLIAGQSAASCCDQGFISAYTDITLARADASPGTALLAGFPLQEGKPAAQAGRIYIVDPLGNLMMSYRPGTDPRHIYQDLKKLLKLSHIG